VAFCHAVVTIPPMERHPSRVGAPLRSLLALALVASLGLAGCTKSEAQLSAEALARGLEAHRAGDLYEASAHYERAIRHDPESVIAYYDLGLVEQ
jgi:Tfp pilus assembly protein PilF